jgi:hypothetical protein
MFALPVCVIGEQSRSQLSVCRIHMVTGHSEVWTIGIRPQDRGLATCSYWLCWMCADIVKASEEQPLAVGRSLHICSDVSRSSPPNTTHQQSRTCGDWLSPPIVCFPLHFDPDRFIRRSPPFEHTPIGYHFWEVIISSMLPALVIFYGSFDRFDIEIDRQSISLQKEMPSSYERSISIGHGQTKAELRWRTMTK